MAIIHSTDKSADSRRRILQAARVEIENKGILGLRVQDVAKNAGVSVPLIYKYFGDRDGLLADVLAQMFNDCSIRHLGPAGEILSAHEGELTVDKLIAALLLPQDSESKRDRELTVQMLAASAEIPALAKRLAETEREIHSQLNVFIAETFNKLGLDDRVPVRALSMLIQAATLGQIFNDMLGDNEVEVDEMASLLRVLVEAVVEKHTPPRS